MLVSEKWHLPEMWLLSSFWCIFHTHSLWYPICTAKIVLSQIPDKNIYRVTGRHKIQVEILLLDSPLISSGVCVFIADLLNYCHPSYFYIPKLVFYIKKALLIHCKMHLSVCLRFCNLSVSHNCRKKVVP